MQTEKQQQKFERNKEILSIYKKEISVLRYGESKFMLIKDIASRFNVSFATVYLILKRHKIKNKSI